MIGPTRRLANVTEAEFADAVIARWGKSAAPTRTSSRVALRLWLDWCRAQGWSAPVVADFRSSRPQEGHNSRLLDNAMIAYANKLRASGLTYEQIAANLVITSGPRKGRRPSGGAVTQALTRSTLSISHAAAAASGIECVVLSYERVLDTPAGQPDKHGHYPLHPDTAQCLCRVRELGVSVAVTLTCSASTSCELAGVPQQLRDAGALVLDANRLRQPKPHHEYFMAVHDTCEMAPKQILHVGPEPRSDVLAALAAGMKAALTTPDRRRPPGLPDGIPVLNHARELPHLLKLARDETYR
ncbi:HAD hydrolase-like protein [Spirillospora sp. CA-294931]|uniref:HAD hydrolase-like protein n=1 Tax=Spirillospora sp. CA-294931 TaxID=3240042 RepID=UPI003D8D5162